MFDTEKFIHAVKCRPAIYNPKCEGYNSKEVKSSMWLEIAVLMYREWPSLPTDMKELKLKKLSTKWKSIRDHFVKELRMSKTGQNKKKRKYIYSDELKFLLPTIESKQLTLNVSDSENETLAMSVATDGDPDGSCNITVGLEEAENESARRDGDSNSSVADHYNRYNGYDDNIADVRDLLEIQQRHHVVNGVRFGAVLPSDGVEPDYRGFRDRMGNEAFLMSLLPILNKLPPQCIMDVRIEIMQTLQKYAILKSE